LGSLKRAARERLESKVDEGSSNERQMILDAIQKIFAAILMQHECTLYRHFPRLRSYQLLAAPEKA
jgi:hypothetical protein